MFNVLAKDPVLDVTSDGLRQKDSPPATPEEENLESEPPKEPKNRKANPWRPADTGAEWSSSARP